ncbi:NADH dehydrogenase (quinone) [Syntrophobotulus glycolicus DSM 8271]|uniref:NADH dehydrogenase (Quinone) n=1 Tax=Syntrophobotulus glycolicus (strain DSM 8271 / FlGlyR) TaxID=645991 RepID=F0SVM1_SYNGF|nr:hydrogenase 4 subunit F [Syntrophobotulus glycolicus]ADY54497.1 NADH dehydrogenase (quinone) [Syntrophobotulus glycolicus DSM 8271]
MSYLLLILPLLTALLCAFLKKKTTLGAVNVLGGMAIALAGLFLAGQVFKNGPASLLGRYIYIDALSAFIISIISVIGLLTAIFSLGYLSKDVEEREIEAGRLKWYYFWFYIFIFTMFCVVMAGNMGIMWVSIEATTLASALLVGFYDKKSSLEAAWKYIIICTVGIIFALFGTILLHYAAVSVTGESLSLDWLSIVENAEKLDPKLLKLAFVFALVGYGTKAGLAPMHTWLPDAHSQAPAPVSAILSGVLLNCALYGILRFHLIAVKPLGMFSHDLLLFFGLISILIAMPFIIAQHDLKRLLAYSSIEHMGLITFAVGIGSKPALYGAFLHMLNHAFTKSFLFFGAGNITQYFRSKKIGKIKGAIKAMPRSGLAFFIGAFAIAGLPPFSIFLSEFIIFSAGFSAGRIWHSGLVLIFVSLIFTGIIYAAGKIVLGDPPGRIQETERRQWTSMVFLILLVPMTVLGFYIPAFVDQVLLEVVAVMAGGN